MAENTLELAARQYCELMQLNPETPVVCSVNGADVYMTKPQWQAIVVKLKEHEAINAAVQFANAQTLQLSH